MSTQAHIDALKIKEEELNNKIRYSYLHHASDQQIKKLKVQRLHTKDQMLMSKEQE